MQIQDENMNTNDLSNFSINANSTNNSSNNTKKKDDKDKQKSSKRGLGNLLRKSTPKENTNTEDGTEHTELDTTQ